MYRRRSRPTPSRTADERFAVVAEIACDPDRSLVYEHGWQSWSPAGLYRATATSPRPARATSQTMGLRPGKPAPERGFQGEGLLAVAPNEGPVRVFAVPDPAVDAPSIRASAERGRITVSADGPVVETAFEGGVADALAAWADAEAAKARLAAPRTVPPGWCSWYCYWAEVREADVLENLAAADRLDLPIAIVQIDDGWEAEIGDWLETSPRFGPLDGLAARIRATGRAGGVWTAPFLVGSRSRLAVEHPDWLVGEADAGRNWGQRLRALDVTHPGAAEHLVTVYRALAEHGFTYHKLDFLYAGALDGRRHADASPLDAYREGLRLIRGGIGPEAILLACGAPLLPSVGLVDAMRVSPDVDPAFGRNANDRSRPGGRNALATGRARAWMHGRFWTNDPDCLLVRPEVGWRDDWAAHVAAYHAVAFSSDPLDALDGHGLELTRTILRPSSTAPVAWDPLAGPDQGTIVLA